MIVLGLDANHFRNLVVTPTLHELDPEVPYSDVAEMLVLETIWHESSKFTYLAQLPHYGPALGIAQIEQATFNWLIDVIKKKPLWAKFKNIAVMQPDIEFSQLAWNLKLSVALCRYRYSVIPDKLPDNTIEARAEYWYQHYNGSGVISRKYHFAANSRDLRDVLD